MPQGSFFMFLFLHIPDIINLVCIEILIYVYDIRDTYTKSETFLTKHALYVRFLFTIGLSFWLCFHYWHRKCLPISLYLFFVPDIFQEEMNKRQLFKVYTEWRVRYYLQRKCQNAYLRQTATTSGVRSDIFLFSDAIKMSGGLGVLLLPDITQDASRHYTIPHLVLKDSLYFRRPPVPSESPIVFKPPRKNIIMSATHTPTQFAFCQLRAIILFLHYMYEPYREFRKYGSQIQSMVSGIS